MKHAGIIGSDVSSQEKYMRMVQVLDGVGPQMMEITLLEDKLQDVKQRMMNVVSMLNRLSEIPKIYCLVCSAIAKKRVQHVAGCPSTFNICFRCLGQHHAQGCAEVWFQVARNFCWKCWMPLFDICGVSFHSKNKDDIITCKNEARDFVKPLAACFWHKRLIVDMMCPCSDIFQYQRWLFLASQDSVSGIGQVPNILLFLETILENHMNLVLV